MTLSLVGQLMNQSNAMEKSLTQVAYSHCQPKRKDHSYRKIMEEFCKFQNTTPEKILAEYEITDINKTNKDHNNQTKQSN